MLRVKPLLCWQLRGFNQYCMKYFLDILIYWIKYLFFRMKIISDWLNIIVRYADMQYNKAKYFVQGIVSG